MLGFGILSFQPGIRFSAMTIPVVFYKRDSKCKKYTLGLAKCHLYTYE